MASPDGLTACVERLFRDGVVLLRQPPFVGDTDVRSLRELLAVAFHDYRLSVPGPPVSFDPGTAELAARLLLSACWFLVSHRESSANVERELTLSVRPKTAAQHLSADLLFRYLPPVYRRARARAADDVLTHRLARLLRDWPLSGVLSDVSDGPDAPPDFDGHSGLQLLYAERLAANEKPAWVPAQAALGWVERVYDRLGKPMPWINDKGKI